MMAREFVKAGTGWGGFFLAAFLGDPRNPPRPPVARMNRSLWRITVKPRSFQEGA